VLDLGRSINGFAPTIREPDLVIEIFLLKRLNRHVSITVNRRDENGSTVLPEVTGKIGTAAQEAHANGRS
jgi:hypothetical protein